MAISVKIPPLGESVTQAVLLKWHKVDGDRVSRDEPLCELETDKANVDVPSPADGVIHLQSKEGDEVQIGQEIASVDSAETVPPSGSNAPSAASQPRASTPAAGGERQPAIASPAAGRIAAETGVDPATVKGSGRGGRVTKEDMLSATGRESAALIAAEPTRVLPTPNTDKPAAQQPESTKSSAIPVPGTRPPLAAPSSSSGVRRETMTKIRLKIAERLVAAQQTAAILTTFNEVDLTAVQDLRGRYKDRFNETYGVGLGLMSFFARACVQGLREFPRINAFIEGNDVVYHDYVHLGIAVSTDRGLAVPVLRNVQALSFAQIESEIRRLATSARDGKLAIEELSGGTFTITNGGVFGSLLSTPILNPPQSGILGMHTIQKRPVALGDKVEIRPMMYIALSYDHRLVDGRESVSFLVRLKQLLEDPARLMLEI